MSVLSPSPSFPSGSSGSGSGSASTSTPPARRAQFAPISFDPYTHTPTYKTILYHVDSIEKIAYISLNRPQRMNAIIWPMPAEIRDAVQHANNDENVRVIVVKGEGTGFCSGYDLKEYAESERGTVAGSQEVPYDPYIDYIEMNECTECYLSLWHSYKPTIAMVHGYAVAGGSDIALCCDLVIMSDTARIGYPPARLWGSPTTHQWTYRIGAEQAKRMLLTGDVIDGREAARIGLVMASVPFDELQPYVLKMTRRMRDIPQNQLFFNKFICNMVGEGANMQHVTRVATMLDGMTRHTPEGVAFQQLAQKHGFQAAISHLRGDPTKQARQQQQQQQQQQPQQKKSEQKQQQQHTSQIRAKM